MANQVVVNEFRLKLYPKDFNMTYGFYKYELGLPVAHEWNRTQSKGAMFKVGNTILELLWPSSNSVMKYRADVSWQVPDVWKLYEAMKDEPYVIRTLQDNAWGDTPFHIQDPEGFKITFFTPTEDKL